MFTDIETIFFLFYELITFCWFQESDHEAYELPPVPPQKTCGSGLPKAHVAQADYPVSKILNEGMLIIKNLSAE